LPRRQHPYLYLPAATWQLPWLRLHPGQRPGRPPGPGRGVGQRRKDRPGLYLAHPAGRRAARPGSICTAPPAAGLLPMSLKGLYAITDSTLLADGRLLPYVEAALAGGASLVQYRDKSADAGRRLEEATQLKALCAQYGAHLLINDDLALASQLQVGVHLGRDDGSLREARQQLGPQALVGATCHASLDYAEQAVVAGASYIRSEERRVGKSGVGGGSR